MSNVSIGWDETSPADASNLGLGAGAIRSLETSLRVGLGAEHVWPSSSGNAGAHLQGSAVAFFGTDSRVSSADTDGRLMVTSTNSRLWHVGSTASTLLGGRYVVESQRSMLKGSSVWTSGPTQVWAMEVGQFLFPKGSNGTAMILQNTYIQAVGFATAAFVDPSYITQGRALAGDVLGNTFIVWNWSATSLQAASVDTYWINWQVVGYKAL